MRSAFYAGLIMLILTTCSIERVEELSDADQDFYHAIMRKHYQLPGCDLFFELDDGTFVVPYMLDAPLMMPDGQEVEISFTVMEDIDAGCTGGILAQITALRQVGCGPVIDLAMEFANYAIYEEAPDDFEFVNVDMVDDCLKIVVSYSGGCEIHEFLLYAEPIPAFDEIQGRLFLSHYGHGDACKALIRDTVCFDLTPLQRKSANHSRLSLTKSGDGDRAVIYIDYYYK